MHMVSTVLLNEILSIYGHCAQNGGSTSTNFFTFSPDIPYLQPAPLFVLLANVQEV